MSHTRVKTNFVDLRRRQIREAAEEAAPEAAEAMRAFIAKALDDGSEGISSDTRALALSLYVKTTGRNDYDQALAAARAAFAQNPSRYRPSPASEKARNNFEKIIASFEPLEKFPPHVHAAAVSTALAYGNAQEFENGEWMEPAAIDWAAHQMGEFYRNSSHLKNAYH